MDASRELELLKELDELDRMDQMDRIKGAGKATLSGAAEGVVGATLGLPGDVRGLFERMGAYKGLPAILTPPKTPSTEEILQAAQGATGVPVAHQPQGPAERYLKSMSSGVSSFLTPPAGQLRAATRIIAGLLSGATGEAAATATQDLAGARPAGQVAGGILPLILGAKKSQLAQAAHEGLKGLGEPMDKLRQMRGQRRGPTVEEALARAAARAAEVEGQTGARPTLAQAGDDPSFLSGLSRELAMSPAGQILDRALNKQTAVGHNLIDEAIQRVSSRQASQSEANKILAAGEKAIERPGRVANAVSQRDYRQAKDERLPGGYEEPGTYQAVPDGRTGQYFVPGATGRDLANSIQKRVDELNLGMTDSGKAMHEAARKIRTLSQSAEGIPVKDLDAYRRQLQDTITRIEKGTAVETGEVLRLQGYKAITGLINDALKNAGPALAQGKGKFALVARTAGKQMEQSPMPDLFSPGARETSRGSYEEMTQIFARPDKYGPDDIRFVAEKLRRADPEAFPSLVRQFWEKKIDDARSPVSGRTSEQAMNDWASQVIGAKPSRLRENFLETVRQIHTSAGRSPQEVEAIVRGADAMGDALLMFSRDRGGVGQLHGSEFRRAAGANMPSAMGRSMSAVPAWSAATWLERNFARRAYREAARALTEPGGAQVLIDIANHSTPLRAAEGALRMMVSASAQNEEKPD